MRYFLEIAYRGENYHGWQVQPNAQTVQEVLNQALSTLLRQPVEVLGSGRTDTGVHCLQQFAHLDFHEPLDTQQLCYKLNTFLPKDIAIRAIRAVRPDAHARFSATKRTYVYRVVLQKEPFFEGTAWHFKKPLDFERLQAAAKALLHHEDFEAFSKINSDVNHHRCQIFDSHWDFEDEQQLVYRISANRFLRGMVRIVVGNLLQVGAKAISLAQMEARLTNKQRTANNHLAPAQGLFLSEVVYPEDIWMD